MLKRKTVTAINKRKKKNVIFCILCGLVIAVCGVIIALCVNIMNDEQKAVDNEILKNETIRDNAVKNGYKADNDEDGWTDPMDRIVDFDYLSSVNTDISAWLYLPNPYVDLPVMQEQTVGYNYYIDHDYMGDYSFNGSLLTPAIPDGLDDAHKLIFGHNIDDTGIFFSALPDTFCDSGFAENNPYAYMYYPDRTERWQIYTSCYLYSDHDVYDIPYTLGSDTYGELLDNIDSMGNYRIVDKPDKNTRTLVLSTCRGYQGSSKRFIVVYVPDLVKYHDDSVKPSDDKSLTE